MTATRQAAWRSGATNGWHDDLIWYAAAVHQMRLRTPRLDEFLTLLQEANASAWTQEAFDTVVSIAEQWSDPFGLGYQSQMHGTWVPAERWPQINGNAALWKECAHNHWFFLPWHRAYLLEFEAICRAHIAALEGPADSGACRTGTTPTSAGTPTRLGMPLPLRGETLPTDVTVPGVEARSDGLFPNPLWIPGRSFEGDGDAGRQQLGGRRRPRCCGTTSPTSRTPAGCPSAAASSRTPPTRPLFHDQTQRDRHARRRQPHGSVHVRVNGAMAAVRDRRARPRLLDAPLQRRPAVGDLRARPRARLSRSRTASASAPRHTSRGTTRSSGSCAATTRSSPGPRPASSTSSFLDYAYDTTAAPPACRRRRPPTTESEDQPFGLDLAVPEPVVRCGGRPAWPGRPTSLLVRWGRGGPGDDRCGLPRRGHLGPALRRPPLRPAGADVVPGVLGLADGDAGRHRRCGPLRGPALAVRRPRGQPRRRLVARRRPASPARRHGGSAGPGGHAAPARGRRCDWSPSTRERDLEAAALTVGRASRSSSREPRSCEP